MLVNFDAYACSNSGIGLLLSQSQGLTGLNSQPPSDRCDPQRTRCHSPNGATSLAPTRERGHGCFLRISSVEPWESTRVTKVLSAGLVACLDPRVFIGQEGRRTDDRSLQ